MGEVTQTDGHCGEAARTHRARRLLAATIVLFAGVAEGCRRSQTTASNGGAPTRSSETDAAARAAPRRVPVGSWEALAGQRTEDPLANALEEFAVMFGPLPGVTAPRSDGSGPFCATSTMRVIRSNWSRLTPEQQSAVRARLREQPAVAQAGFFQTPPRTSPLSASQREARYRGLIERAVIDIRGRTGATFDDTIDIVVSGDASDGATRALAEPCSFAPPAPVTLFNGATLKRASRCRITVYGDTDWYSNETQYSILAHEVFHCFQYDAQDVTPDQLTATAWRYEGSAAWVGEALARGTNDHNDTPYNWWNTYLEGIYFSSEREHQYALMFNGADIGDYSAIGVYAHFARHLNLWPNIIGIVSPTLATSDSAWRWLVSRAPREALTTYASAPINHPEWGGAWGITGPGAPVATVRRRLFEPPVVSINAPLQLPENAAFWSHTTLGAQWGYRVRGAPEADIVTLETGGIGRAIFGTSNDEVVWAGRDRFGWCMRPEGCQCANGQAPAGLPPLKTAPRNGALTIAFTQDPALDVTVPRQTVVFDTLQRRCDRVAEPTDCRQMTGEIDPCLTRHRWAMRNNSARGAYDQILRNVAGNTDINIQRMSGRQVLQFRDSHESTIALEGFGVFFDAMIAGAPMRAQTQLRFSGEAAACFSVSGRTITSRPSRNNIHVAVETRAAGFSTGQQGMNVPNDAVLYNHPVRYTCSNTMLTLERADPTPFTLVFDAI